MLSAVECLRQHLCHCSNSSLVKCRRRREHTAAIKMKTIEWTCALSFNDHYTLTLSTLERNECIRHEMMLKASSNEKCSRMHAWSLLSWHSRRPNGIYVQMWNNSVEYEWVQMTLLCMWNKKCFFLPCWQENVHCELLSLHLYCIEK